MCVITGSIVITLLLTCYYTITVELKTHFTILNVVDAEHTCDQGLG